MRILLMFLLVEVLGAQTRVTPDTIQGTPGANPRVWVVLPNGTLAEAELDNIQLVITPEGKPVLRAPLAQPPVTVRTKIVLAGARADFPVRGSVDAVYRNGLLMAEGDDYTVANGTVHFLGSGPQKGDIVQIRELR